MNYQPSHAPIGASIEGNHDPPTITQLNTDSKVSNTFVITNEDHTLANVLRYVISRNPKTDFCGYSIPHPSERKVNFRIQTRGNHDSLEVMKEGLQLLSNMCTITGDILNEAYEEYSNSHNDNDDEVTPMDVDSAEDD